MKKILIILALFFSLKASSQCDNMLFPTIDSLRTYINIYVRNSAVTSFTNLRLNTAMVGITQWLDCLDATGGSGGDNTNVGTGYRLLNQLTQELRTLSPGYGILIDSALSGRLRITADTANFPKDTLLGGWGVNVSKVWGQITHTADSSEVTSVFATSDSLRVAYDLINSRPTLLMNVNDTIVFSGGATVIRIPTNGNILIVAEGRSNPIDFTSANLYYWIWDGRAAQFMGRLFPTGYIDEPEEAAASLYLAPNGTIQVIFAGYLSDGDNSFYRSELTVNPSTNVITPSGSPTLLKNFTTFALLNNHRVIRASTGRYYLPYSIFISGSTTSLNDASSVYNGKLMVSDDGMTWRETSTTIYSPDSLVAEPGIYESDVTLSDPKGSSTGKLVYYWRNRRATATPPGTIYYAESGLANDTTYSQYLAMGIDVPNAPLAVINYKKRLYAIHNKWLTNATTQDEVRKEMVISVGHEGEQLLNTRVRVAGNENDTLATTAPIIWVDSVTNNIFAFYTDLQQTSGRGAFWMKRYDIDVTEPPTQDRITTLSTLDIIGGANIATGTDREFFRLYSNTRRKVNGYFAIGNGISSQYQFLPQLTFVTDQSIGAFGAYFKSFVGSDAYSSMYSGAFVFDGFTPAAGTLTNAPIATFISNGNQKFSIFPDNRIVLSPRAGDPTTPPDGSAWYNSTSGKFRVREGGVTKDWVGSGGGSSYTFAESLVDNAGTVTLVNDDPSPGAYKFYGFNGSSVIGYHSPSLDYNSDVQITSPLSDQALVYDGGLSKWRNFYVIRPSASALTSGIIPIASGDRTLDNSELVFDDPSNTFNFGGNKISLGNSLTVTSGSINTFISWNTGGIVGTSTNHMLELWTNGAQKAVLNTNGTLNATADYSSNYTSRSYIDKGYADGTYATLASPTFTGTPAAPTAAGGTNTTQLATTAFVQNAISTFTSGTHTSTLTGVTNISNGTAYSGQYLRVGNTITYSFKIDVITAGAGATEIGISLPVASDFSANGDAAGSASTNASLAGSIEGDTANDRLALKFTSASATTYTFFVTVTYRYVAP